MTKVAVVGAVNADYVMTMPALPGPGETVTGATLVIGQGGKGANQAHAAARLGAQVRLVAAIGADEAGRAERAALEKAGIDTQSLAETTAPTGVAAVLVDSRGENAIVVAPGANDQLSAGHVRRQLQDWLVPGAVLLASLEVPVEPVATAAHLAREAGALAVVNPAPGFALPPALVRGVVLTPNQGELARLVPGATGEEQAVAALLAHGARAVVVTKGAAGADLHEPGAPARHRDAPTVTVTDTVGAGDAFNGALAWSLSRGATLDDAVAAATAAGAAACTGAGARAALPGPDDLARLLGT